jgi:hypothetical protein
VLQVAVEQQELVEVSQRGELARHRAPVHLLGEEVVEEVAHVRAARRGQGAAALLEELGELADVAAVGGHAQPRQPLFYLQVVEEGGQQTLIGGGRHERSMRVIGRRRE